MKAPSWHELEGLLEFLNRSPTAWHAAAEVKALLDKAGFQELKENEKWGLLPERRYYVIRNGSSLLAFATPSKTPESALIAASHLDSPGFKLKPHAEFLKENMVMLAVEVYGSPLINSWLNRDLGIAGRIVVEAKGKIEERLVRIDHSPLVIPQLAIHLDRQANDTGTVLNKQEHLTAIACLENAASSLGGYLNELLQTQGRFDALLGSDLYLYPLEPARFIGSGTQMIAGYRIDSLCSVHAATTALLNSETASERRIKAVVFWDHEEIGSHSAHGAGSPFLPQTLERILLALGGSREDYFRMISQSLCVSVDLSHALHPNYTEKHEPRHKVLINKGLTIKANAQHRYATDARSEAIIVEACQKLKIPLQRFSMRGDIPCGSTVGPISANLTGLSTVDIGAPQLSMHSCRELAGCEDHLDLCRLLKSLFSTIHF